MLLYEPKETTRTNVQVLFTKDKENDYDSIMRELKLFKKNGEPYKYITVQKKSFLNLYGGSGRLPAIKITTKDKEIYIVNDSIEVKVTNKNASEVADVLSSFGGKVVHDIDGREFKGKFTNMGSGAIKDSDGTLITLGGGNTSGYSNPDLNQFIYKMRQDNGRLLAPIMQKYITALHFVGKNRNIITGYAHLGTYLQLIKSPMGNIAKSLRNNKGKQGGLVLGAGENEFMIKTSVRGVKEGKLLVSINTNVKLSKMGGDDKTPNPYVLFSTKPIKFTSEEVPKFVVNVARQTIFVSIFMFDMESHLGDLKGGMNLLKSW